MGGCFSRTVTRTPQTAPRDPRGERSSNPLSCKHFAHHGTFPTSANKLPSHPFSLVRRLLPPCRSSCQHPCQCVCALAYCCMTCLLILLDAAAAWQRQLGGGSLAVAAVAAVTATTLPAVLPPPPMLHCPQAATAANKLAATAVLPPPPPPCYCCGCCCRTAAKLPMPMPPCHHRRCAAAKLPLPPPLPLFSSLLLLLSSLSFQSPLLLPLLVDYVM
jgi:hypothetical protein